MAKEVIDTKSLIQSMKEESAEQKEEQTAPAAEEGATSEQQPVTEEDLKDKIILNQCSRVICPKHGVISYSASDAQFNFAYFYAFTSKGENGKHYLRRRIQCMACLDEYFTKLAEQGEICIPKAELFIEEPKKPLKEDFIKAGMSEEEKANGEEEFAKAEEHYKKSMAAYADYMTRLEKAKEEVAKESEEEEKKAE